MSHMMFVTDWGYDNVNILRLMYVGRQNTDSIKIIFRSFIIYEAPHHKMGQMSGFKKLK